MNIDRARDLIKDNPCISYDEIEAETSLIRGTIENIILKCLKMKKLASRWIMHELTEKKSSRTYEMLSRKSS